MDVSHALSSAFCALALAAAAFPADASLHPPTSLSSLSPRPLDSLRMQAGSMRASAGGNAEGDVEGVPNLTCIPRGADPVMLPIVRYPALNRVGQVYVNCWEEGLKSSDFPFSVWVNALGQTAQKSWDNWSVNPDQTFFIPNGAAGASPVFTFQVAPAQQALKAKWNGADPGLGCSRYDFEAIAGIPGGLPGRVVTGNFVVCNLEAVQNKLESAPASAPQPTPPAPRP